MMYSPAMRLSPHFQLWEFIESDTAARYGIDNFPNTRQLQELIRVAHWLEQPRARFGVIRVSSGLRVRAVNARVKGSSKTSAHQYGRAVDWSPLSVLRRRVKLVQVFEWCADNARPFDQLVYEYGRWIHTGLASNRGKVRGQTKVKMGKRYERWVRGDPRLA